MITHPSAEELLTAVAEFRAHPVPPDQADRHRFLARVAQAAEATVARERALGAAAEAAARERLRALLGRDGDVETLNHRLCAALRAGIVDPLAPALLAHLRASAIDQIAIDQPAYGGLAALLAGKDGS